MSVIVLYRTDNFSIILADKRISYGKNQEYGYYDNDDKLIDVPNMGGRSGTRFASFLSQFKEALTKVKKELIQGIKMVLIQVWQRFLT